MLKKIGHLEQNTGREDDQPEYIGTILTKDGELFIKAWIGRNREFKDYISLYFKGHKVRVTTERLGGDYYGNIDAEDIVPIVVKPVYNENKNIVIAFGIYYEDKNKKD